MPFCRISGAEATGNVVNVDAASLAQPEHERLFDLELGRQDLFCRNRQATGIHASGIVGEGRSVPEAPRPIKRVRAHSEPAIRNPGPVADVMSTLLLRKSPVRDFIVKISRSAELFFRTRVEGCEVVVFWNAGRQPSAGAALLLVQHVNGDVFGSQLENTIKIALPGVDSLSGQTRDEIQIDVAEPMPPQHCEVRKDGAGLVQAAGADQVFVFERLGAEADSGDTEIPILLDLGVGECSGIHLNADFCRYAGQRPNDTPEQSGIQERRGAPAKIDCAWILAETRKLDFSNETVNVRFKCLLGAHRNRERAVVTPLLTERNVNIKSGFHFEA